MRKRQYNILDELIVDNFAGGGGASTGIELALGRPVDIAINHDISAIAMHEANGCAENAGRTNRNDICDCISDLRRC